MTNDLRLRALSGSRPQALVKEIALLKSLTLAGALVAAALTFGAGPASAASFGNQSQVAETATAPVETVQYGYGYRRGYYGRRFYGPRRYYGPRRFYGGPVYGPRRFYGRPYGYGPRPFYRY
jgi:hypothetical protein